MYETSPLLHFAEDTLQIAALSLMAIVYALKIRWILKFPAAKERQKPTAPPGRDGRRGALYSLAAIALPWAMASYRERPLRYVQFAVFHLAVAASILMSFLIPYAPETIASPAAVAALQAIFAAGILMGLMRLRRRLADAHVRVISTPDDYFSLALLIVWLGTSIAAAPNAREVSETPLLAYFFLTAFFLVYVPFSKISHYIYYPFARYYLGKTLGRRGAYPLANPAAMLKPQS